MIQFGRRGSHTSEMAESEVEAALGMGKGGTIGQMGLAGVDLAASPIRTAKERSAILARLSQRLIYMRCTDAAVISFCFVCGFLAIFMQTLSLGTERWLFTIEPRPINLTDRNGHQREVRFEFNSGYWRVCRQRFVAANESLTEEENGIYGSWRMFRRICVPQTFFKENVELGKLSGVTASIMARLQLSAIIHCFSVVGTMAATVLSVMGYVKKDQRSLYSGIGYISSGIGIMVAVMQFICIVDDEMAPRMKPNAQGEPSKHAFFYGYSFLAAALSFLVNQICAVCQLALFFRRFPGMEGKLEIVPGLREKIHRAKMDREMGMLPPPTPKKPYLSNNRYDRKGNLATHSSPAQNGAGGGGGHSAADSEFTFDDTAGKWDLAEPVFRGYEPHPL